MCSLRRVLGHLPDSPDPHQLAHLGELHALLEAADAPLGRTAAVVDAAPGADHRLAVAAVRSAVERAVREVVDRAPRMAGPELTAGLAERCAAVLASDPVPTAVERGAGHDRRDSRSSGRMRRLPAAVPHEPIDLAVFSEVRIAITGSGVGALRALGLRRALARLGAHFADRTWLLSTDADTTVPLDWACAHLRLAEAGAHGVAGLAERACRAHLPPDVLQRYRAIIASGLHGQHHEHVYGANLGFRGRRLPRGRRIPPRRPR